MCIIDSIKKYKFIVIIVITIILIYLLSNKNEHFDNTGFVPTVNNIKGGYSKDRGDLYVCKIKTQDASGMEVEYSGQIATGENTCSSTDDGIEIKGEPTLFNASEYDWVNDKILATPTGFSYNNFGGKHTLFTCRGIINDNNSIQIGKAWRDYNFCNIPFNGKERLVKPYDFLRIKKSVLIIP
jgi:hypothetical protein